jgi:hypothetical protein
MAARLKRDPAGVASYYAPTAAVIDDGRRHVGGAAVYALWARTPSAEWTQEIFDLGGTAAASWVAGRSVISPAANVSSETFFIRLLRRDATGELKIQSEVRSARRTTGTPAEIDAASGAALDALRAADAATLVRMLNDGFVGISTDGVLTKRAFLAQLDHRPWLTEADRIDDVRARIFGALAVVTGAVQTSDRPSRELTSLWLQTGHGWRMTALQLH